MSIQPEGEDLRKAVKWISDMRKDQRRISLQKLIDEASVKFNLSPKDGAFLARLITEEKA